MAHVACNVGNCGADVLAKGMCRLHYDRWRKYGDPTVVGNPGPPTNPHVAAMTEAGVTVQQRSRWAAAGLLGALPKSDTGRYEWTTEAVRRAIIIRRLLAVGLALADAAAVAKAVIAHPWWRPPQSVEIAPGLWLEVVEERRCWKCSAVVEADLSPVLGKANLAHERTRCECGAGQSRDVYVDTPE